MKRTVAYQSIRNGLRVDFPRDNRPPASCGTIVCADYSVDTDPPFGLSSITTPDEDVWIGETREFVFNLSAPAQSEFTLHFHIPGPGGLEAYTVDVPAGASSVSFTSGPLMDGGSGTAVVFTTEDAEANQPLVTEAFYPFAGPNQYLLTAALADPDTITSGDTVTYTLTLDHPMALADSTGLTFSIYPDGVAPIDVPVSWDQGETETVFETPVAGDPGVATTLLSGAVDWYGGGSTTGSEVTINP